MADAHIVGTYRPGEPLDAAKIRANQTPADALAESIPASGETVGRALTKGKSSLASSPE